jgi:eukaryotic-like serine/threonine-protein kinase
LFAQALDLGRTALVGEAIRVAENVYVQPPSTSFSVSQNGVLVYWSGGRTLTELTWVRRDGTQVGSPIARGDFANFAISRDGRYLVADRLDTTPISIWTYDLERGGAANRRTFNHFSMSPVWSPDGARIAFASAQDSPPNLYTMLIGAASGDERLTRSSLVEFPNDWSPDGQFLVFGTTDPKSGADLWVLPLSGDRTARPIVKSAFYDGGGSVSPDGHWLAYNSDQSGRSEIYVTSFPNGGDHRTISNNGGFLPVWRSDGRELYYRIGPKIMAVPVKPGPLFEAGAPQLLFEAQSLPETERRVFRVAPDGRFLLNRVVERTSLPLTVVTDWRAGLVK